MVLLLYVIVDRDKIDTIANIYIQIYVTSQFAGLIYR